jgi:hypothetical protein
MNGSSYYRLSCHTCGHTVELPARDGVAGCPNCDGTLGAPMPCGQNAPQPNSGEAKQLRS